MRKCTACIASPCPLGKLFTDNNQCPGFVVQACMCKLYRIAVLVQMRATAHLTLAPLVESLPCLGAVTITLLEEPYIDLSLALIGGLDLMQLPGVHDGALYAAQTVRAEGDFRLFYSNSIPRREV